MADLALKRQSAGYFDLDFESNDLKLTDGLENAAAISLGCFARNRNLPENKANLKPVLGGWWADALSSKGPLGGYLNEILPGKDDAASLKRAETLAADALAWLKEDGIANKVSVTATSEDHALCFSVEIEKPNGANETFVFEMNWEATENGV